MEQIVTWLSSVLRDKTKRGEVFSLRGPDAQSLIDGLNYYVSDPSFRRLAEPWLLKHTVIALRKLCETSMLYPTCYVLQDIQDISSKSGGGFCDIHQGRYNNQLLCLKVARLYQDSDIQRLLKAHAREAILWGQLDHPNVVPFYGIFYWDRTERICLVSPWMRNGDIVEYLERVPSAPRKLFIHDIASGLQYLHDRNIVHRDLKGRNVLIDDYQNARLADFGLSTVATDETLGFTRTTSGVSGHTTRWASPELLDDDVHPNYQSDLWAFGCVCYEVLAGRLPFTGCSDIKVLSKLMRRELPADLDNTRLDPDHNLNKKLCELVGRCWSIEVMHRPDCQAILRALEAVGIVKESRGSHLDSFTTLRVSASNQFEQARNVLQKIYGDDEETYIPFDRRTQPTFDIQDRPIVFPYTPRPLDIVDASAILDSSSLSEDTRRPALISELGKQAQKIQAENAEKTATSNKPLCYSQDRLPWLDVLPHHPQYMTILNGQQRQNLFLDGQDMLCKMSEIKPVLSQRFSEWQAAQLNHPLDRPDQEAQDVTNRNWRQRERAKAEEVAQQQGNMRRHVNEIRSIQHSSSSRNQLDQQKDSGIRSGMQAPTVVDAPSSLSEDPHRPTSITELEQQAREVGLDLTQGLKKCLWETEKWRNKGMDCLEKGDLEQAFMLFARTDIMIRDTVPLHPQYMAGQNEQQRQKISLIGQDILDKMGEIKPVLMHRLIAWKKVRARQLSKFRKDFITKP